MRRRILFALATFVLVIPVSRASDPIPNGGEWTSLDREIAALSQELASGSTGPRLGGFLRIRGAYSNTVDLDATAPGTQDLAGFCMENIRIQVDGDPRNGWNYRVSIEAGHQAELDTFSGPGVVLMDGWVDTALCKGASLRFGQFCMAFLWSPCNDERNLLFLDRSFIGENWDNRDVGAQLAATYGPLDAWIAVQNGFDGKESHDAFTGRAVWRAIGEGGWCCEGACFGGGHRLAIGAAIFEDQSMDKGSAVGFDALYVQGPFSAHAEVVHYGTDMRPMPDVDPTNGVIIPAMMDPSGAQTPWDATLSYAFVPDVWEVGVRGQFLDDAMDTSVYSIALNRYVGTRNVKWTAEYDRSQSDDSHLEYGWLAIGLTIGI
jgi:Phosphate-selective porin O and P